MRFIVKHGLDTDVDTFWNKIFFDEAFNRALCVDFLKFRVFRVLEFKKEDSGVIRRRIENCPAVDVPQFVARALGDTVNYVEDGRFDPAAKKWFFTVIPAIAGNKIQTVGELWAEPRGEKKIERFISIDLKVKVFGIGGAIEGLIEKQTCDLYDKAAIFTQRWIREKAL